MKQYKVTGMSCAACVARVEQAVNKIPGVDSCSVSLLTNSMGVEGNAATEAIIKAVEDAGYGASEKGNDTITGQHNVAAANELEDTQTPILIKRLLWSLGFLLVLMYFAMGHSMWGFRLPYLFEKNMVALAILQMLLSAIVMIINQHFFISGFKSALHLAPNMDTLVALGSFVSFAYSVWNLFLMTAIQLESGIEAAKGYMHGLYFESAAMILVLITVGKTLEARSKGKTTDALKSLMQLTPKNATVIRDGKQLDLPIEQVVVDDIYIVKPGQSIPVDGIILEGNSAIDESALTGESIPVDKVEGDEVSASTINQSGFIKCRATRVGKDTTLAQIIEMVSNAAATKAPIAKIADRVAGIFVPCVLAIAFVVFCIWLLVGAPLGTAISYAISVLVISCPCSLGLATPVAIMVGNGMGAKNGILYKTAASLEGAGRIQIAVFDKTGTITKGDPQVTDIYTIDGVSERSLLEKAYALEAKSEHPLARAIVKKAEADGIELLEAGQMTALPGKGLSATINENIIFGGNERYIKSLVNHMSVDISDKLLELSKEGKTPLLFAEKTSEESMFLGIIAVADVIKEDAKEAVNELKNMGIQMVMLTGDNQLTAKAIAKQVGIDHVVSGVLPGGKEEVISRLKQFGRVAMIGDGINDAPALTHADIGIAIGSGTDVAIDAAEIVLMNNGLKNVPAAIRLGRATLKNIKENLFWAFFYNSVAIPIAAGAFAATLGLKLNPMLGALAMSLSSFCVVTNALRLNLVNIFDPKSDKIIKNMTLPEAFGAGEGVKEYSMNLEGTKKVIEEQEENTMTKTLKIEGMMCGHCEARVKKTLEAIAGVASAEVSHEKGTAVVTLTEDIDAAVLKEAVEAQDYKVLDLE